MIDKSLVKNRFQKSFKTYDENALVQKQMAEKLIDMLGGIKYASVFEIGSATGTLTKVINENIIYDELFVNDIVGESFEYVKKFVPKCNFIEGDIENINLNRNFDLIISNASFQWMNSIEKLVDYLYIHLNQNGILAFSVFGENNLKELKKLFGSNIPEFNMKKFKQFLKKYKNIEMNEEIKEMKFTNPIEILKHLKLTGANAVMQYSFTRSSLNEYSRKYMSVNGCSGNVILTYNPVYVIIRKN